MLQKQLSLTRKETEAARAAAGVNKRIAHIVQFDGRSDVKQWLGLRKDAAHGKITSPHRGSHLSYVGTLDVDGI